MKKRIEIKCGNCEEINIIKPPRKYLKKTWYIDLCCGYCGKMTYIAFYREKLKIVDIED